MLALRGFLWLKESHVAPINLRNIPTEIPTALQSGRAQFFAVGKMALTDLQCRKAKAQASDYCLPHDKGLFLMIRKTGNKFWMCDFVSKGVRHKFSYGEYPAISLEQATKAHALSREVAATGGKPAELLQDANLKLMAFAGSNLREIERALDAKKEAQAIATFEQARAQRMTFTEAAEHYYTGHGLKNWKYPDKTYYPIKNYLIPSVGAIPLEDVSIDSVRELCYDIRERNGTQAALHVRGSAARVFDYAIEHGWCIANPARAVKAEHIGQKGKRERWLKPQEIKRYLTCLYQADCYRGYKIALHLLLMLAMRKNELCGASWSEINIHEKEIFIPAKRMKTDKDHQVFLPRQAVDMLAELKRLGGGSVWVFPMKTDARKPMSGALLNRVHKAVIEAAQIDDYVIHDHRHTASTNLRDMGFMPEVVEKALSHSLPGTAGVYSHAQYKTQRLDMMQKWADYLENLMAEQTVIAVNFGKQAS